VNVEQLLLQVGVAGAVIWAVVKLGLRFIDKWSANEAKRTDAIAAGFAQLGGKVDAHTAADLASHQALATGIASIQGRLNIPTTAPTEPHAAGPVRLLRASTENER